MIKISLRITIWKLFVQYYVPLIVVFYEIPMPSFEHLPYAHIASAVIQFDETLWVNLSETIPKAVVINPVTEYVPVSIHFCKQ